MIVVGVGFGTQSHPSYWLASSVRKSLTAGTPGSTSERVASSGHGTWRATIRAKRKRSRARGHVVHCL
jgi:hypothetical protein